MIILYLYRVHRGHVYDRDIWFGYDPPNRFDNSHAYAITLRYPRARHTHV